MFDDAEALLTMRPAQLIGLPVERPAPPLRRDPPGPPRDIHDLIDAARVALDTHRHHDAVDLLTSATSLAEKRWGPDDPRLLRLRLDQAEARRLAGEPDAVDGLWAVVDTADEVGDTDTLARAAAALCRLGPSSAAGTLDERLAALVERAIQTCNDLRLRAECHVEAALFYSMTGSWLSGDDPPWVRNREPR